MKWTEKDKRTWPKVCRHLSAMWVQEAGCVWHVTVLVLSVNGYRTFAALLYSALDSSSVCGFNTLRSTRLLHSKRTGRFHLQFTGDQVIHSTVKVVSQSLFISYFYLSFCATKTARNGSSCPQKNIQQCDSPSGRTFGSLVWCSNAQQCFLSPVSAYWRLSADIASLKIIIDNQAETKEIPRMSNGLLRVLVCQGGANEQCFFFFSLQ